MKLRSAIITAAAAVGFVAHAQASDDTFNQNMDNANQVYNRQQQEQGRQQMQEYQNRAGNFNPGPTDMPVGRNTYVSPSYHNGAPGVTVTHTYK